VRGMLRRPRWLLAMPLLVSAAALGPQPPALRALENPLVEQDRLAQLRSRYDRESDPVRKAKRLVPLGDAEFDDIQKQMADGNTSSALGELREYQTQVDAVDKALDAKGRNAEKHPNGYKELQFSVRESLRRLNNVIVNLTSDQQPPFLEIRKSLEDLNRRLITELFPSQPGSSR
jgi:tRNA nucleotidyltransferase/poly(A) polymerase